ncbi:MAG UNVERIFIED_CONTAM: hypothetical protein LVT10_23845 [Anaerolineae bacterium]
MAFIPSTASNPVATEATGRRSSVHERFCSSGQLEKPNMSSSPASHGGCALSADGELTDSMVTEFSDDFQHIKHESEGMIQS